MMKFVLLLFSLFFLSGCGLQKIMPVLKGDYQKDKVEQAEVDLKQNELMNEVIVGQDYFISEEDKLAIINQQRLKMKSNGQLKSLEKRAEREKEALENLKFNVNNFLNGVLEFFTGDKLSGIIMAILSLLGIGYGEKQRRNRKMSDEERDGEKVKNTRLIQKINLVAGMDGKDGVKYIKDDPDII